jgi:release factor glutamine methyltransferase
MQPARSAGLTIRALLAEVEGILAAGPHPEKARRDAEVLLLLAWRADRWAANRAWLIAHDDQTVGPEVLAEVRALAERRLAGEPIQYITGETEFYGLPFSVNRDTLIPRPETEHLVERAGFFAPRFRRPRILDVGTGSGAIAVALAHEWPHAQITATDISAAALELARWNAQRAGFGNRVHFLEGDLLAPVAGEQFDIVVSNPPYVPERDRDSLSLEVRSYEPAHALFAGPDGLAIYRRLIPAAFAALVPGGFVLLEIGFGQREALDEMLAAAGFADIEFTRDLQGIPRVASARRPISTIRET